MTSTDDSNNGAQNRREFLGRCMNALAGITIVGVAAPILQGCEVSETTGTPPPTGGVTVDVSTLDADGKGLFTTVNAPDGHPAIVVRQSAATYITLSSKCTHEGCGVNAPANGFILCGCHGSEYNLDGTNRKGPATLPLTQFPTTFDATTNTVTIQF